MPAKSPYRPAFPMKMTLTRGIGQLSMSGHFWVRLRCPARKPITNGKSTSKMLFSVISKRYCLAHSMYQLFEGNGLVLTNIMFSCRNSRSLSAPKLLVFPNIVAITPHDLPPRLEWAFLYLWNPSNSAELNTSLWRYFLGRSQS